MEKQLSSRDEECIRAQLRRIVEPLKVSTPPINAFRDLVALPDGEIRHYGHRGTEHEGQRIYIASQDCGLSWQEYPTPPMAAGAAVQSPWSGDFLTVLTTESYPPDHSTRNLFTDAAKGLYVCRSRDGIDGAFSITRIPEERVRYPRQPMALRSRKRWIAPCQTVDSESRMRPAALRSDDDGVTWQLSVLSRPPAHEAKWPHKGVRWQNYGCEPTIAELSNGRLFMLIRTSTDTHYHSWSDDAGETWATPEPSRFYATITMPTLFQLSDGRLILFWCNTTPLPELDHDEQHELEKWEREGYGEDVFTNRDAFHAAISEDDGKTWIGFRELALNPPRNDADFRTSGGNLVTLDKSMHQAQAVELPEGKVLVSHGQHPRCREILIFDPAFLYENQREEDFRWGLGNWSVHQYVKGIIGNYKGFSGHCAYNRRPGPQMVPSPDGQPREVLQIARYPDPRLVSDVQGAVWNFPAGHSGELRITLWMPTGSQGVQICLMDRWLNPTDWFAPHAAQFVIEIDGIGRISKSDIALATGAWQDLVIRWADSEKGAAQVMIGSGTPVMVPLKVPSLSGISYLHFQSLAPGADYAGVLFREVKARTKVAAKGGLR